MQANVTATDLLKGDASGPECGAKRNYPVEDLLVKQPGDRRHAIEGS